MSEELIIICTLHFLEYFWQDRISVLTWCPKDLNPPVTMLHIWWFKELSRKTLVSYISSERGLVMWPRRVKPLTPCPSGTATLASGGLLSTPGEGLRAFIPGIHLDNCLLSSIVCVRLVLGPVSHRKLWPRALVSWPQLNQYRRG